MAYECISQTWSAICSCLMDFHTSSVATNTEVIPSSSSSASPPSRKITYDVFLSFRGPDTRNNFTDHLYTALNQKGISTFRDDEELERGESIRPNLLKAIEESRYVIVVFSQSYADSAWCLDEIAKVADCMKAMGQKVLPVFYHVDPSEVRRQTGVHFGKAFQKHQRRYKGDPDRVKRWKEALLQVGNLSGWHLQDGYESKVIQEIVEKIFTELNKIILISEGLVGMDSHLNEMLSYLDIGCADVRIVGICGMGGIGKTTIAQVVFETVQAQFEGCSFLENVREVMEKQGAVHLQEQLLSNLLKCKVSVQNTKMGKNIMRQRLCTKRVLIILDDVDQEEQLEALCDRESFGPGSRIIITSRDKHLLRAVEGDKVYNVNPLTDVEALQLFIMKAFQKDEMVGEEVLKLSTEILKYADGLPLAIKVLGSSVKGRSVQLWPSALDRLKKSPDKKIMNVLRFSFDGLEPREQTIFLDIACFLKGVSIDRVRRILQGSDAHCPDFDIQVLLDKSMVTLFGKRLWMHDLIQELGWEVVRQECHDDPGKRSRLWLANEIILVLCRCKATSAIQSIFLQSPTEDDAVHSVDNAFKNMDRLRLLKICNVNFSGNIRYISNELQYLEWHGCPLDSFPSEFQPDKLVEVHMYYSRIKQLWRGKTGWSMLRLINLSGSQFLLSTPDFTEVPDLENLDLQDCTSLVEIHPSLGFLKKLISLNMRNCKSIESIPPFSTLESLQVLNLSLCSGLKKFPEVEGNMKSLLELHLDGTGFEELPLSIECLTGLTLLNLADCKNLLRLPNTIGCLSSLKSLYLTGCSKLDEIAEKLNGMKYLEKLFIGGTSIRKLSFIVGMKNLQYLFCRGCKHLVSESFEGLASSSLVELDLSYCELMDGAILNDLSYLISLSRLNLSGNCFVQLPESIYHLSKLNTVDLSNCRQLQLLPKYLPPSLKDVLAHDCTSLTDYPNQIKVLSSLTVINSLNSSAPGVSEGLIQKSEGDTDLLVKHKHTVGEQDYDFPATSLAGLREVEMASGKYFTTIHPGDEIPEWFSVISTRNSISTPIPENMADDTSWKGFAVCAIFSVKGHTALSVIEPDPERFSYSYQVTLVTDDVCQTVLLQGLDGPGGPPSSLLQSSSHLIVIFYIPSNWKFQQRELNESNVVTAIFETTNPSMVVQKCAIRLVYDQDDGWYSRGIMGFDLIYLNGVQDAKSEKETEWLSESWNWEKFIQPLEEESTLVLRKNLESLVPRYLEALNCYSAKYKFSLRGSPGWFHDSFNTIRSNLTKVPMELPQNLHKSKKWMGFAIFVSLVEEAGQITEEDNYRVFVALTTFGFLLDRSWDGLAGKSVCQELKHVRPLSEEHHELLVFYVPRAKIPEALFTQTSTTAVDFYIKIESPHVKFQRFGFRIVYQEDIQGLADTVIQCMQREGSLESYDKFFVEQGAHLQRMTERDSRTPREKQFDSHSRKYRNWDWSDPRPFLCRINGAEIFKSEWFMPFIIQGNSAEIQLPLNVFDDDDWLGFAVCSWVSHDQRPDTSLGSIAPDTEDFLVSCYLNPDVDGHYLFGSTMYANFTAVGPCNYDFTLFFYIPRTKCVRTLWRQCKLARVTTWLSKSRFAVHSCALRLVFKEDVEHLVEILTLAELP